MSQFPSKNIDNESDFFDFLLFDQNMNSSELLENIESMILSLNETSTVHLRIGKLFNSICKKLSFLFETQTILTDVDQLNEIKSFLELFDRCLNAVRFSTFSAVCIMPDYRMQLDINRKLFINILELVTNSLNLLPENLDKLMIRMVLFVLNTPEPYITPIEKGPEVIFNYLLENLYNSPNKNYFKFLTIAFWTAPPRLVNRYLEEVISNLKAIIETTLQINAEVSNNHKDDKLIIEDQGENSNAEEDTNYEILRFLLVAISNEKVKKQMIIESFHQSLYDLLRSTCPSFGTKSIKLPPRISKLITSMLNSLLPGLSSAQLTDFKDMLYHDICISLDEKQTGFIMSCLVPLLSTALYSFVPVCIHFDHEIENSLNDYKSKSSKPQNNNQSAIEHEKKGALNSQILTPQEKESLLKNIQKISFSSIEGSFDVDINACEWHCSFKVDLNTLYPFDTKNIHQDLQKSNGVFLVFQCLLNNEICKVGAFCFDNFIKPSANLNALLKGDVGTSNKVSFNSPKSFIMCYSNFERYHLISQHDKKGKKSAQSKKHQPSNVFVHFTDNKITLNYDGSPVLEYFPVNPDNNKVSSNLIHGVFEEKKIDDPYNMDSADEFSFIQNMECWVLNLPKNLKQSSGDEAITSLRLLPVNIVQENLSYVRSNPIILVPSEFTVDQMLSQVIKGYNSTIAYPTTCRILPQEYIEPTYQIQKLLDLYQGKEQNVLDIFLSSERGVKWFKDNLIDENQLFEKFRTRARKNSDLIRQIFSPEKLQVVIRKITIMSCKNNKQFLTDYTIFITELETFLTIGMYHQLLIENEMFFFTLLQILDVSLKNAINTYNNKHMFLKLEQILYKTLSKTFKMENSKNLFSETKLPNLIKILLEKITQFENANLEHIIGTDLVDDNPPQDMIGTFLISHQPLGLKIPQQKEPKENEILKRQSEELKQTLTRKILKYVIYCTSILFDWGLPADVKKDAAAKIKQFDLISPISKIIADVAYDNHKPLQSSFYKKLISKHFFN